MSRLARPPSEAEVQPWETEDDLADGDLGYGLGRRPGAVFQAQVSQLSTSSKRSDGKNFSPLPLPGKGEERRASFQSSRHKSLQDTCPKESGPSYYGRQSSSDSNSELSNAELKQRLHDTLEEIEILKTELEASQRQLEGKEEALKILQSMAIFGKATSHTQVVLQKTMEQKRSLEKEVNALQWEIEFDQNRFKSIEESWTQKYDRLNCENAVLQEALNMKTEEIKMLKSENALLNQQYLEALAMLEVKQQMVAQENICHDKSGFTEVSSLELAVLGSCLCHGLRGSPCACAQMAASARKMLLKLKQELGLLQKSKDEAYIMADAFRIAFEQQLMRKNDQALRLTQMDKMCKKPTKWINWKHLKEDGLSSQGSKKTLGQKLLGMLPSENSSKKVDDQNNPEQVFKMLIELLNDKEEALAHQRKVSYMLARALEEKNTTSNVNKEKNPMKDNFALKSWGKSSEFPVLHDPPNSSVQILNSVGCICSIQHPHRVQNCTRTLKRSCSLPSNIIF
ncbi:coiled-coil domain-containing protein 125 isoform X1 [Canis lupus familiaris]|uniref:Coiled-coil domain containing 125 n=1 Tax=Canis lupus familiaris TaxID=9615 RepID=A0A8C0Q366_CANLF|nr:coiled-coil domain-containing protein 125 isoform X1 [Canis lupus familiaris]XP_038515002.1 coiled-coil domain-containing protein 125 isoform X1 [Canis lupus familiaris]XP_038515003.1 coiled-coil domain-containing protein 125 isoform X1 [Canis lupus familiaris]XP_038515004.1 coiled-coil domain-containing protein 125 isoform X1 [Canis lupus familiaris]XP_038515005.1 coiled-coil domain-containing protein 125 isoform X1 [Canis lupus familiaris]